MLCTGLLSVTAEGLAMLGAVQALFEDWSGAPFAAPVRVTRTDPLHVMMTSGMVEQSRRLAAHGTRLSRELFRLRAAYEELLNNFEKAERLINDAQVQTTRITFINPPAGTGTGRNARALRQVLPVSSRGLAAIELHIAPATERNAAARVPGGLAVELWTVEDHQRQAGWAIEPTQCNGWVMLALPVALGGLARTLELRITPLAGFGALPALSLGAPLALAEFRCLADGTSMAGALALRCWSGLAGMKPPAMNLASALGDGDAGLVNEVFLPPALLFALRRLASTWQPEWPVVQALPQESGVFCHPPPPVDEEPAFTAVAIDGLEFDRPLRISAWGVIKNDQSAPVEFAMGLVPTGRDPLAALVAEGGEQPDVYVSGWGRATFEEPCCISLTAPPAPHSQTLVLATRMADGRMNYHAWSVFKDIRLTFMGPRPAGLARWEALPQAALTRIRDARNPASDLVQFDPHKNGAMCHPAGRSPTAGVIGQAISPTARGVRAHLNLANAKANPVEFAVAVSSRPASRAGVTIPEQAMRNADMVFSGWLRLAAEERGNLELDITGLSAPPDGRAGHDFYVFTRMAPDQTTPDWAWAVLTKLETLLPAAGDE